jgi:hypothetical protein
MISENASTCYRNRERRCFSIKGGELMNLKYKKSTPLGKWVGLYG